MRSSIYSRQVGKKTSKSKRDPAQLIRSKVRKKPSKSGPNPAPPNKQEKRSDKERDNILRPELFSVPRHGHVLMTKERRKGEERSLVARYLELADIALNNDDNPENGAA
jgi:hypothetical protein